MFAETSWKDRRLNSEAGLDRCSRTSSFRTRSYHRIPSSCLRHFWWKASRVLTSADSKVQVSVAYSNTDKTSVWYKWSLVSSVRRLSLHIRFRDAMTAKARPIRRVRSGRHWPPDPQCIHSSNLVLIIWHLSRKIQERRQCRQHCWGELQRVLPYSNVLAAISKGTWAIKLCINKILQFLTGRAG